MATTQHGPFIVVGDEVATAVNVQVGDVVELSSLDFVDFGGAAFGAGAPILPADGDNWATPSSYPAPSLKKNSLICRIGNSMTWIQGGVIASFTVPLGSSGELILRTNDEHPEDNSRGWRVTIRVTTPPPPPPPPPNTPSLQVIGIEVVQAIQRADNAIRIVRGKSTMVRVFVDSGVRDGRDVGAGPNRWPDVTGLLLMSDATTGVQFGALAPANPTITARPAFAISRDDRTHSLNFFLPLGVVFSDTIIVTAQVSVRGHQGAGAGWEATTSHIFQTQQRPSQQMLPILIADGLAGTPAPALTSWNRSLTSGALPRFPMANIGVGSFIVNPPLVITTFLPLNTFEGGQALVAQLATMILATGSPVGGIRAGLIPFSTAFGGVGTPRVLFSIPSFIAVAGDFPAFAHELGHALGVHHANGCGAPGPIDSRLPATAKTDEPGFDVDAADFFPSGSNELMSHCRGREWVSTNFYNIIFDEAPI